MSDNSGNDIHNIGFLPFGSVLTNLVVPVLQAALQRASTLVSGNAVAKSQLEKAAERFKHSDVNGDENSYREGAAYMMKSFVSLLPDGVLNGNFWNAISTLTGKDTSGFVSAIKGAKTQSVNQVVEHIENTVLNNYKAPALFSWITNQVLKGEIGNFTDILGSAETLTTVQKVVEQARKGTLNLAELANSGKAPYPSSPGG